MWHMLTEKRHTGPEERQGVTTQPEGVRGKSAEQMVFKPRPQRHAVQQPGIQSRGQWWVQQRISSPRKAAVKAEDSSQLLDDVKDSVDSGVDAVGEGWQRKGAGERG